MIRGPTRDCSTSMRSCTEDAPHPHALRIPQDRIEQGHPLLAIRSRRTSIPFSRISSRPSRIPWIVG